MGIGIAFRELMVVVGLAMAGLSLAALAVLVPWHPGVGGRDGGGVVTIEGPGGAADSP